MRDDLTFIPIWRKLCSRLSDTENYYTLLNEKRWKDAIETYDSAPTCFNKKIIEVSLAYKIQCVFVKTRLL
jgi:hypothetical protein